MITEFNASFENKEGREWVVKLTTRIALKFCGEHNLPLSDFLPDTLNAEQFIKLCWAGIQHHQDVQHIDYDIFIDSLDGEPITKAMEATRMGIVNFTLARIPENRRVKLRAIVQKSQDELKASVEAAINGTSEITPESQPKQE